MRQRSAARTYHRDRAGKLTSEIKSKRRRRWLRDSLVLGMATKEELLEINDQLQIDLDRALEQLRQVHPGMSDAEREKLLDVITRLNNRFEESERERLHAAQMLQALTAAQTGLEKIFDEKEQILLARLNEEARKMAEERRLYVEETQELRAEMTDLRRELTQTETARENQNRQLASQSTALTRAENTAHTLESQNKIQQGEIARLRSQLNAADRKFQNYLEERPPFPMLLAFLLKLSEHPGWIFIALILIVFAHLIFSVVSWIWP